MAPIIAFSPRLTLQILTVEDHLQSYYELEKHPQMRVWSSRTAPSSIEATLQHLNNCRPTLEKPWAQIWAICLKPEEGSESGNGKEEGGTFIGAIGFPRECDVGYSIHPAYWGKGYMTEALRMFVDMFFNAEGMYPTTPTLMSQKSGRIVISEWANMLIEYKQYDRMSGHADPANIASNRVFQKAGAVKGEYKKELYERGSNPGVKLDLQEYVFERPTS
jgi:ribosomal-protein-alanine N-acetyltransferase